MDVGDRVDDLLVDGVAVVGSDLEEVDGGGDVLDACRDALVLGGDLVHVAGLVAGVDVGDVLGDRDEPGGLTLVEAAVLAALEDVPHVLARPRLLVAAQVVLVDLREQRPDLGRLLGGLVEQGVDLGDQVGHLRVGRVLVGGVHRELPHRFSSRGEPLREAPVLGGDGEHHRRVVGGVRVAHSLGLLLEHRHQVSSEIVGAEPVVRVGRVGVAGLVEVGQNVRAGGLDPGVLGSAHQPRVHGLGRLDAPAGEAGPPLDAVTRCQAQEPQDAPSGSGQSAQQQARDQGQGADGTGGDLGRGAAQQVAHTGLALLQRLAAGAADPLPHRLRGGGIGDLAAQAPGRSYPAHAGAGSLAGPGGEGRARTPATLVLPAVGAVRALIPLGPPLPPDAPPELRRWRRRCNIPARPPADSRPPAPVPADLPEAAPRPVDPPPVAEEAVVNGFFGRDPRFHGRESGGGWCGARPRRSWSHRARRNDRGHRQNGRSRLLAPAPNCGHRSGPRRCCRASTGARNHARPAHRFVLPWTCARGGLQWQPRARRRRPRLRPR